MVITLTLLWQRARQMNTAWRSSSVSAPAGVLILSAHPDDEVMFFSPIILSLLEAGTAVWGLCLSQGDADGLGDVRRKELQKAYGTLGVDNERVTSLNDGRFRDGMSNEWQADEIVGAVKHHLEHLGRQQAASIDTIITFDAKGVSRHPNHIALYRAAQLWLRSQSSSHPSPRILALQTLPLSTKFLSLFGSLWQHQTLRCAIPHLASAKQRDSTPVRALLPLYGQGGTNYLTALRAMRDHASQLVWFRYLYILLSGHMWGSVLCPVYATLQ
ncbi:N-acetylglucosaminyl phosphatidylinositol de-N-acetylase [Ceraceosorus bombacis]|uniref:N-acetylglucosaminylphosphatidylinositol deacetylase n=1 Tax=Ceraceosorus bombacis TaxID=401625 RepID=A0A0P1BCJ1_9BASI|nr:N-acetylglucosaminyl phosphatidylinositol de-N-acetylase [Ceraceosorus bombacis]